jgi:cell wall-associated protease
VAGIIGADRNNSRGINGVADAVQIMPVRAIPYGYGLDIDQANSIRYAAENGTRVISMRFGLNTLLDRKAVEEAVKYALSKDVLFIQAAGNGHENLDNANRYPSRSIVQSVVKRDSLKDLCISGGVVNAFNAIKLAETY